MEQNTSISSVQCLLTMFDTFLYSTFVTSTVLTVPLKILSAYRALIHQVLRVRPGDSPIPLDRLSLAAQRKFVARTCPAALWCVFSIEKVRYKGATKHRSRTAVTD